MQKGLSQSKRDNAWHIKNTNKKAALRKSHIVRSMNRFNGVAQMSNAERQYARAQARERLTHIGLKERIQLGFKKLFNFSKPRYA